MTWKRFPHYWPFHEDIHRWIPFTKGQWYQRFETLWCSLACNMNLTNFVNHCHEIRNVRRQLNLSMMTSSNENIFRVTGPLCAEFTGHRWFPRTKASDAEPWCFLWSPPEATVEQTWIRRWFETPSRSLWRHCNVMETSVFNKTKNHLQVTILIMYIPIQAKTRYFHLCLSKHKWFKLQFGKYNLNTEPFSCHTITWPMPPGSGGLVQNQGFPGTTQGPYITYHKLCTQFVLLCLVVSICLGLGRATLLIYSYSPGFTGIEAK